MALADPDVIQVVTPWIPLISMLVALVAVFLGPLVSWKIARRQIAAAIRIGVAQITAPARETWIRDIRESLAEISGLSQHYWAAGFEERRDREYQQLEILEQRIALMLDPDQANQSELLECLRTMMVGLQKGKSGDEQFFKGQREVMRLSRKILRDAHRALGDLGD